MSKAKSDRACPAKETLDILSEKHALHILHILTMGERGFNDIQETLDINTATLSIRLQQLEKASLIEKRVCKEDSRRHYYALTKKGTCVSKLIKKLFKAME